MRIKTNYLVGIGILIVVVVLVAETLLAGTPRSRLRAEAASMTMPNVTIMSESYDKGSNCMDACASLTVVYKFDSAGAVSMEALFDKRMRTIGYGYVKGSTPPYTWTKGQYYVEYRWLTASGQEADLPLGAQLVDELSATIYDRVP
jgi:hypothetical protein